MSGSHQFASQQHYQADNPNFNRTGPLMLNNRLTLQDQQYYHPIQTNGPISAKNMHAENTIRYSSNKEHKAASSRGLKMAHQRQPSSGEYTR